MLENWAEVCTAVLNGHTETPAVIPTGRHVTWLLTCFQVFQWGTMTHTQRNSLMVSDLFAHTAAEKGTAKRALEGCSLVAYFHTSTHKGRSGDDVTNTLTPVDQLPICYLAPQQLAGVVRCVRPSGLWWCIINLFGRNPAEHCSAGEEIQHLPMISHVKQTVSKLYRVVWLELDSVISYNIPGGRLRMVAGVTVCESWHKHCTV